MKLLLCRKSFGDVGCGVEETDRKEGALHKNEQSEKPGLISEPFKPRPVACRLNLESRALESCRMDYSSAVSRASEEHGMLRLLGFVRCTDQFPPY